MHGGKIPQNYDDQEKIHNKENDPLRGPEDSFHEKKSSNQCGICGKTFSFKGNLNKHSESVHEKKRPYGCHICDKRFINTTYVRYHIASVHEKSRPNKCTLCGASFFQNSEVLLLYSKE